MPLVDTIGDVKEVVFVLVRCAPLPVLLLLLLLLFVLLFEEAELFVVLLLLLLAPFEDIRETRAELTNDALFNCRLFDCFTD